MEGASVQSAPAAFTLFTLGYQGHSIETFLDLLLAHGVEQLIDVRQPPLAASPTSARSG